MNIADSEGFGSYVFESLGWVEIKLVFVILLQVDSNRCARGAGSRLSEDEAGSIWVSEDPSLVVAYTTVNWVSVLEDLSHITFLLGFERIEFCHNLGEDLVGCLGLKTLIIVSLVVVSSILSPVLLNNLLDGDERFSFVGILGSKNLEPAEDCPNTVFFSNVRAPCSETFFTADGNLSGIKKVAEELPTSWCLIVSDLHFLSNFIEGTRGWHTS